MGGASAGVIPGREGGIGCEIFDGCGKKDGEDGSVAGGGLAGADVDAAIVAVDDFGADPEAEAVAGVAPGGEEGLVDAREYVGRDS